MAFERSSCVAVIGDGAWGTALAMVLSSNGHRVTVWSAFAENIERIAACGENAPFLPGVRVPRAIRWTCDRREAVAGADLAILAVPSKYFREVCGSFAGLLPAGCRVVSVAKGLDRATHHRMTEVAEETLRIGAVAALSGPSHAEEVARGIPTAVVAAARDRDFAADLRGLFSNERFRVYASGDVIGVELGGALKNVIAIAVGVSDGLGFGDNTRAALMTRGLAEMARLGCARGAEAATFAGLSGMGDLVVTCTSRLSRNRGAGERIGRGEKVADILASTKQAVEGVWNCDSARSLARECGVDVPITEQVYAIVHQGKAPHDAVASLLARNVRAEE